MNFINNKNYKKQAFLGKTDTNKHWAYPKNGMPNFILLFCNKICFFFSIFTCPLRN